MYQENLSLQSWMIFDHRFQINQVYGDFVVQDSLWITLPKNYRLEIYQRANYFQK